MSKLENFEKMTATMHRAEHEKAKIDEFYRGGVVNSFNLTFEMAWKAMKEWNESEGTVSDTIGSPRSIIKTSFQFGLIATDDEPIWLNMLDSRNHLIHIYDEDATNRNIDRIFDEFIPAFDRLLERLKQSRQ